MWFRFCLGWCIATLVLFFSSMAGAQNSCVDIFAAQDSSQSLTVLPEDAELLTDFQKLQKELIESTSIRDANSLIFEIAGTGNRILDYIAQNIIQAQRPDLNPQKKTAFLQSSQIMAITLGSSLRIPEAVIERAIGIHIEKELEHLQNVSQAIQDRVPVGFTAELAKVVDDVVEPIPIGFTARPATPETAPAKPETSVENLPENFETFVEWLKNLSTPEEAPEKQPIGFVHYPETGEPVEKQPIGFVHYPEHTGNQPELNRLVFDAETGMFEVEKPGFKLGF